MDMFDGVGRRRDQREGRFLDLGRASLNGRERNCLFRNNGDGTFTDVAWVNDAARIEDGRGLSVLDYDRDGSLDLVLRNYRREATLLRNRGGGRSARFSLVGVRSNRDAVGARVRLRTPAGWQTRVVEAGSGYLSGHSLVQHFGLGPAARADRLEIRWPSGARSVRTDLKAGAHYLIVEGVEGVQRID